MCALGARGGDALLPPLQFCSEDGSARAGCVCCVCLCVFCSGVLWGGHLQGARGAVLEPDRARQACVCVGPLSLSVCLSLPRPLPPSLPPPSSLPPSLPRSRSVIAPFLSSLALLSLSPSLSHPTPARGAAATRWCGPRWRPTRWCRPRTCPHTHAQAERTHARTHARAYTHTITRVLRLRNALRPRGAVCTRSRPIRERIKHGNSTPREYARRQRSARKNRE